MTAQAARVTMANAMYNMVELEKALKILDDAEKYLNTMNEADRKKGLKWEALIYNIKGGIYHLWYKYELAVEYFEKSYQAELELGKTESAAYALSNIGEVHYVAREYGKGNTNFQNNR